MISSIDGNQIGESDLHTGKALDDVVKRANVAFGDWKSYPLRNRVHVL